jgi:hypothetical protein
MAGSCLEGCCVFVTVTHTGGLNASAAFGAKLTALGATVAKVLTKSCTHIVFKGEDAGLKSLYERAAKVSPQFPAMIVRSTWQGAGVAPQHLDPSSRTMPLVYVYQ